MTPEEKRAKQAEYMRKWRAANPERARETARRSMEKWRIEHPEESRDYFQKWKDDHRESIRATQLRQAERQRRLRATDDEWRAEQNAKARGRFENWKGVPESELQARFAEEQPDAISMDRVRPDFYIPGQGFIELKRALPYQRYMWNQQSVHFPALYFLYPGRRHTGVRFDVDTQISLLPRPLTVLVFHALTTEELAYKIFD